jgi:hypothetical protein
MPGRRRSPRPRPYGPGIPGDYFECNEEQLIQKLHTLRGASEPFAVPSLLGNSDSMDSSSLNTAEDDPNCFYEDFYQDELLYRNESLNNAMERLDGEQLSVSSQVSTGTDHHGDDGTEQDDHDVRQRDYEHGYQHDQEISKSVSHEALSPSLVSGKSWEGSEVVLDANSFVVDPSLLEKVQSEMNQSRLFNLVNSPKRVSMEDRSDASPRSVTKLIVQDSGSSTRSPPRHGIAMSLIEEDPASTSSNHETNILMHPELRTSFKRRWSFSSSVDGGDDEQYPFDLQHSRPRSIPRPGTAMSMGTTSSSGYTSLGDLDQELFMKLSEGDDLRDFKHINNFSFDGDYLLSRILRERMRIQLKREMLTTPDKDLYLETQKISREANADKACRERRVFFMI